MVELLQCLPIILSLDWRHTPVHCCDQAVLWNSWVTARVFSWL